MKNPIELWDDLHPLGRVFSWVVFPVYYATLALLLTVGVLFYGVFLAWEDKG